MTFSQRSRLLATLGSMALSFAGLSCTSSGSNSGGGSSSQPSDNGDQTTPSTACSDRGFHNATYGFGFDPPAGYAGPIAAFGSDYAIFPVLHQALTVPITPSRRIDIEILSWTPTLDQWVSSVRSQRLFGGFIPQSSENFTTESGDPATLLVWSSQNDVIYEAFALRNGFIIALHAQPSLVEAAFLNSVYRSSFKTLCVDPVE